MVMRILVCLTLIGVAIVDGQLRTTRGCMPQLYRTDRCLQRMFFMGADPLPIARKPEDLAPYCDSYGKEIKCIMRLRRCLRTFPKTIYNIAFKGINKQLNNYCTRGPAQDELIHHLKCLTEDDYSSNRQMLFRFTRGADLVLEKSKVNDIIPHLCCMYVAGAEFVEKFYDNLCQSRTGTDTGKFFINISTQNLREALDLGCGKLSSIEECTKVYPEFMSNLNHEFTRTGEMNYTALVPMMKIVERLDDDLAN